MSAGAAGEEKDGLEEHLSGLTGLSDEDVREPDDDAPEKVEPEPDEKPEAKEEPEPGPEPDAAEEPEAETDDEEEEPDDTDPAAAEAKADAKPKAELDPKDKRIRGLQAELTKLREERREKQMQVLDTQAPAPTRGESVPVQQGKDVPAIEDDQIPVVVSQDGQHVYVDKEKLRAQMQAEARAQFQELNQPSPDMIRAHKTQQLATEFITENPERNKPIFERAQMADQFISLALQSEAEKRRVMPRSVDDIVALFHGSGVADQAREFFPEIAPVLDEFVAAYAGDEVWAKKLVLRQIQPFVDDDTEPETPARELESLSGKPTSLARKGGDRSASPNSDRTEFEKLEAQYNSDLFNFPEKSYKRLRALAKKLGEEGYE